MKNTVFIIFIVLLLTAQGFACGGGDSDNNTDGIVNDWFFPIYTEEAYGHLGGDGILRTDDQVLRHGIKKNMEKGWADNKKWTKVGDSWESKEKAAEKINIVNTVFGSVAGYYGGPAVNAIGEIGDGLASAAQAGTEAYIDGKSASQILDKAMRAGVKKATASHILGKINTGNGTADSALGYLGGQAYDNMGGAPNNIEPPPLIGGTPPSGGADFDGGFGTGGTGPQNLMEFNSPM